MERQKLNLEKSINAFTQDLRVFAKEVTEEVAELRRHLDFAYFQGPVEFKAHLENLESILKSIQESARQVRQEVKSGPSLQLLTEQSLKVYRKTANGIKNLECHLANYGYVSSCPVTAPEDPLEVLEIETESSNEDTKASNFQIENSQDEDLLNKNISVAATPVKPMEVQVSVFGTSQKKCTVPHSGFGPFDSKLVSTVKNEVGCNRESYGSFSSLSADVCTPTVAALKRKYEAVDQIAELDSRVKEIRVNDEKEDIDIENNLKGLAKEVKFKFHTLPLNDSPTNCFVNDKAKEEDKNEEIINTQQLTPNHLTPSLPPKLCTPVRITTCDIFQKKHSLYITKDEYETLPNYARTISREKMNKELSKLVQLAEEKRESFTEDELYATGLSQDKAFAMCLSRLGIIERTYVNSGLAYKFGNKIKL